MATTDLDPKALKALLFIRDQIVYRGKSPSLQAISDHLGFKARRSASLLIDRLATKGYLERTELGNLRILKDIGGKISADRVIEVPLVGNVPCGLPLLAEENIEAYIPVSQRIARPGAQYFLLRAMGDSMNMAGIDDGDILVVRQQPVAMAGDKVVALIDDSATVKEYRPERDKIVLMPRSSNPSHQPIVLEGDFLVQGVVIATLPDIFK